MCQAGSATIIDVVKKHTLLQNSYLNDHLNQVIGPDYTGQERSVGGPVGRPARAVQAVGCSSRSNKGSVPADWPHT